MIRLNDREFCEIVGYIRDNYGINLEKKAGADRVQDGQGAGKKGIDLLCPVYGADEKGQDR